MSRTRRPRRRGPRPPPPERSGASVRPRGRVPDDTRRQGQRGRLCGADRLWTAEVGNRARSARARPGHRGRTAGRDDEHQLWYVDRRACRRVAQGPVSARSGAGGGSVEEETELQRTLSWRLNERANGAYRVVREDEVADAKRPDIRLGTVGGPDARVVMEVKIADKWTLTELAEALRKQLVGQYLRHESCAAGCLLLTCRGKKKWWRRPDSGKRLRSLRSLASCGARREHWNQSIAIGFGSRYSDSTSRIGCRSPVDSGDGRGAMGVTTGCEPCGVCGLQRAAAGSRPRPVTR